jgi:hypothetical protein
LPKQQAAPFTLDLSDLPKRQAATLTLDLSDLPKQQSAPLQLDLSDLPKAGAARYDDETIRLNPYDQYKGYLSESESLHGDISAPAQSIFASVPRPPEYLLRQSAPPSIQSIRGQQTPEQSTPDQSVAQKAKPEHSWFWQTLESSDTLKPYAKKVREYIESPTDTRGAWDWLTSTVPKSAAQLSVGLAKMPFDITQTFSSESRAAIEKFLQEHPEYEQIVREDPTGEGLQALAGIGAVAGTLKTAEAAAKGAAAFIGKPLGIDTEKQTWTWENFKDAWVNHPVESFAAVYPFGASFLKRKGITPSETQVKELVDSAVKDEKTPLAQEFKKEIEQGPPKEELDFLEGSGDAAKSGATFGQATTNDYRSTFFAANPELEGKVIVRHAVEQSVLTKFPGVVTEAGIHSLENLRGVLKEINPDVHLSQIRREWD